METRVRWISLLFALATTSLAACQSSQAATRTAAPPAPAGEVWLTPQQMKDADVQIQPVADQAVDDPVVTSGRITLDDRRSGHVFSPVTGRVVQIVAQLGQHVRKGEALAVIESPDVGSAVSDVRKAGADLIASEHDRRRKKVLFEQRAGSASDLEASEDGWRKAKAESERAIQKQTLLGVGNVNAVTQTYTLASPIEGDVLLRNVTPGIEVQGQYSGGATQELFTIGEVDKVWLIGDLYEVDMARVHVGTPAVVTVVAYPDKSYAGRVDWVSGVLDPNTRTAKLRCTIDNPDKELRPEMYATVRVAVDPKRQLAVPRDAVLHFGDTHVAFVYLGARDGYARFLRLPVEVDEGPSGPWLGVKRGLERGQSVVTNGAGVLSTSL
ncbi:MAG: efflux RND transporter periplasmic adaptor subunit [Polyangiaceae bacterium]